MAGDGPSPSLADMLKATNDKLTAVDAPLTTTPSAAVRDNEPVKNLSGETDGGEINQILDQQKTSATPAAVELTDEMRAAQATNDMVNTTQTAGNAAIDGPLSVDNPVGYDPLVNGAQAETIEQNMRNAAGLTLPRDVSAGYVPRGDTQLTPAGAVLESVIQSERNTQQLNQGKPDFARDLHANNPRTLEEAQAYLDEYRVNNGGAPTPASPTGFRFDQANEIPMEDDTPEEMVGFRHKMISRFAVGPFEFKNHILMVPLSKVPEFQKAYLGLERRDRIQIVQLRAIENEMDAMAPRPSRAVRGAASTSTINSPVSKEAPNRMRTGPNGQITPGLEFARNR